MNRVVAREALVFESRHRSNNWLKPFSNLILDDDMERGMDLHIRKLDSCHSMIRFSKPYSFVFVEREPLRGIWCDFWIVESHGCILWRRRVAPVVLDQCFSL